MKSDHDIALLFAALAHPTRIAILRALLPPGLTGLQFGALAAQVATAPSTLTHHLREMEAAGLLIRQPTGRSTQLRLDLTALGDVITQLSALCCAPDPATLPTKET